VHLLYASAVWLAAWGLTSLRRGSATAKYWIWVAASLNFVLPVGLFVQKLSPWWLSWSAPLGAAGAFANRVSRSPAVPALAAVWLAGAILAAGRACLRIRAGFRGRETGARPAFFSDGVPVRFARSRPAPAVRGLLRPHVSLPDGIDRLLTAPELDAVLVHEVAHAKRRDNLIRLLHEIGVCVFWFHPFVWMGGARIALYRELSCDESVLRRDRGGELVSALAKLAVPEEGVLLEATASSFVRDRLAVLVAPDREHGRAATALLAALFGGVLLAGVLEAVAHTACCYAVH
jgi:beta-lactamase regulating signal transducer with metallopeptidase domain